MYVVVNCRAFILETIPEFQKRSVYGGHLRD